MRKLVVLGLLGSAVGCGTKSKSTDSDSTNSPISEKAQQVLSTLTAAYPGSLAISVFPTSTGASLLLADPDAPPETIQGKEKESEAFLKGKAANCLPPIFLRPAKSVEEACYEFDQDMIAGTKDGRKRGTPDGKSTIVGSREACLASFARAQVKEIEQIIDQGLGLQQGMICQAIKDEVDVANATNDTGVDLAASLTEAANKTSDPRKPKLTVTEAKMKKDSEGVYRVSISVSLTKDGQTISQSYKLAHVPDAVDNSVYHGVMSIIRDDVAAKGPANAVGKQFLSLTYRRAKVDSATRLSAELRSSRFDPSVAAKAFNADGTLDYNAGADDNGSFGGMEAGRAIAQQLFVGFNQNVADNTGTFEYWRNPGSNYTEPARGMLFKLDKNPTTGRLEGCGMSGAANGDDPSNNAGWMSIRKSIKTGVSLSVTGSYHPFFNVGQGRSCTDNDCSGTAGGAGGSQPFTVSWKKPTFTTCDAQDRCNEWAELQGTPLVTRQCVAQNAEGAYEIDTGEGKIREAAGYVLFNPTKSTGFKIDRPDRPKDLPPPPPPARLL
jgi:hypothetical protein